MLTSVGKTKKFCRVGVSKFAEITDASEPREEISQVLRFGDSNAQTDAA